MNYKQKLSYAGAGFLFGNIILASVIFGISFLVNYQSPKSEISFDEALQRIKSKEIKEVNIKNTGEATLTDEYKAKYSTKIPVGHLVETLETADASQTVTKTEQISKISFENLFQVLLILFIISPPIIVVLLLVIIKKMNQKIQ